MEEQDDLFAEEMKGTAEMAGQVEASQSSPQSKELAVDIHVKENGLIFDNLREIKRQVLEQVNDEIAKVNPDNVDEAKKLITKVNKIIDDIETKRKAVGKEYNKPYETLCDYIKTIKAEVATLIVPLRESVDKAEEERLKIRRAKIDQAIIDRLNADDAKACSDIILSCTWFKDKRWENSSVTVKKVVSEIDTKITQVVGEIEQLDLMGDGSITIAVVDKYKQSGSLVESLRYRHDLEDAERSRQERLKKAEEERLAEQQRKEQAEAERLDALNQQNEEEGERKAIQEESGAFAQDQEETVTIGTDNVPKFMAPNPVEQKVEELVDTAFRIRATMAKIDSLKQFMKDNGILYGPVKDR